MTTQNKVQDSEKLVIMNFLHACQDLREYVNGLMHLSSSPVQVKLVLKNKLLLAEDMLEQLNNIQLTAEKKSRALVKALDFLRDVTVFISNKEPFQSTWLRLISLVSSIKNQLILSTFLQKNSVYYGSLASLLSDLLMDIYDPMKLPELPDYDSPQFREVFVALLNILQDVIGMYDILIEMTPVVDEKEIKKWIQLDLQYYKRLFTLFPQVMNLKVFEIYKRTREEQTFLENYVALLYNYVNFVDLCYKVRQLFTTCWEEFQELNMIIPEEYSHDFIGITQFSFDQIATALNKLELWSKEKKIQYFSEIEESFLLYDLKTAWFIVKALNQKARILGKIFQKKGVMKKSIVKRNEELFLLFSEHIMLLEIILSRFKGDTALSKEFFQEERGMHFIEVFTLLLESVTLEGVVLNNPSLFSERLRPYREVFMYVSPKTHPLFWFNYELLELYFLSQLEVPLEIRSHYSRLVKLEEPLKEHMHAWLSLHALMFYLQYTFQNELSQSNLSKRLYELRLEIEKEKIHAYVKKRFLEYLDEVELVFKRGVGDFKRFHERLEVNAFDSATWAIPVFSMQRESIKRVEFMFLPFHRKIDRLVIDDSS